MTSPLIPPLGSPHFDTATLPSIQTGPLARWCVESASPQRTIPELCTRLNQIAGALKSFGDRFDMMAGCADYFRTEISKPGDRSEYVNAARKFFESLLNNQGALTALSQNPSLLDFMEVSQDVNPDAFALSAASAPVSPHQIPMAAAAIARPSAPPIQTDPELINRMVRAILSCVNTITHRQSPTAGVRLRHEPVSIYLNISIDSQVVTATRDPAGSNGITVHCLYDASNGSLAFDSRMPEYLSGLRGQFQSQPAMLRIIDSVYSLPEHHVFRARTRTPALPSHVEGDIEIVDPNLLNPEIRRANQDLMNTDPISEVRATTNFTPIWSLFMKNPFAGELILDPTGLITGRNMRLHDLFTARGTSYGSGMREGTCVEVVVYDGKIISDTFSGGEEPLTNAQQAALIDLRAPEGGSYGWMKQVLLGFGVGPITDNLFDIISRSNASNPHVSLDVERDDRGDYSIVTTPGTQTISIQFDVERSGPAIVRDIMPEFNFSNIRITSPDPDQESELRNFIEFVQVQLRQGARRVLPQLNWDE